MIAQKIKNAFEDHAEINFYVQKKFGGISWQSFNRTHFNYISELINRKVNVLAAQNIFFIKNRLILGNDMYYSICHKFQIKTEEELVELIIKQESFKGITWVSGKALESYWKASKPKEVKLNTLLVFLEIPFSEWDDWKYAKSAAMLNLGNAESGVSNSFLQNYVGSYFLYCPKTDHSQKVLKCPFVIKFDGTHFIAETITEGHRYKSDPIEKIEGHLQIVCRNLDWNETENHLFNIGLKTKPEIIFGVSVTLSVNMGTPVALKNILVFQSNDIEYLNNIEEKELNLTDEQNSAIDLAVLKYYAQASNHIIFSEYSSKFEEFTKN